MRGSTKLLAITSALAAAPVLAAASGLIDSPFHHNSVEDGFNLDGVFVNTDGPSAYCWDASGTVCTVTGGGGGGGGGWGGGWWGGGGGGGGGGYDTRGEDGGGGGGDDADSELLRLQCLKDNLAYDLTAQIRVTINFGYEAGALLFNSPTGPVSGPFAFGSSIGVTMSPPFGAPYLDFLGSIHSHPPVRSTGDPALDEAYRIADMYPSPQDWIDMERHALAVLFSGGSPDQISMYIVDQSGMVRRFNWSDRHIYDRPEAILLQSIPGLPPRPPLPDPILLPQICGA